MGFNSGFKVLSVSVSSLPHGASYLVSLVIDELFEVISDGNSRLWYLGYSHTESEAM